MPDCRVDDLSMGDVFLWCDREVTLLDWEPDGRFRRPGRYLTVRVNQEERRLHYYDSEFVEIPDTEPAKT